MDFCYTAFFPGQKENDLSRCLYILEYVNFYRLSIWYLWVK